MEEAFRDWGLEPHPGQRQGRLFAARSAAATWAKANHHRQLYASLLVLAAEDHIILAQTQKAEALFDEAKGAMASRLMALCRAAARRAFLQATALYQEHHERKTQEGDVVLAPAPALPAKQLDPPLPDTEGR